ncbi:hypothetical protein [Sphingosinicella sp. CPCC 101087]|uniref:hypothetical protein n=1 Tax=Sphingosinicella sp. CPCC 101087 TaxID=2497754 RepID=UPI00101B7B88|nr:hypothetical protein [Sphingosinicella sp. CPCC 101087]
MTDEIPPSPPPSSTAEKAEAAKTRRRWLTLAELLGLAAVTISGLTLWNNYQQRTAEEADKAAARRQASAAAQTLLLRGTPDREGRKLALAPADPAQTIQDQRILFPTPLQADAVETVSEPRIEAGWFGRALVRLRRDEADRRGDARLPVAIETGFFVGGERHTDVALYDLGYRIEEGGLLGGDEVKLRGLARVGAVPPGEAQARLDALWRSRSGS